MEKSPEERKRLHKIHEEISNEYAQFFETQMKKHNYESVVPLRCLMLGIETVMAYMSNPQETKKVIDDYWNLLLPRWEEWFMEYHKEGVNDEQ